LCRVVADCQIDVVKLDRLKGAPTLLATAGWPSRVLT
jgi:hypothetical protein